MKFYNREKELAQLKLMRERAVLSAQMTVVVGRSLSAAAVLGVVFHYAFLSFEFVIRVSRTFN